jgi:hypothetical protein
MILEQIFSGNIRFSNSSSIGARLQDYLMMLLFAMGGAVAVRHVGPLVTGILSQAAATGEQMTGAAGWAAGAKIAGVEAAGVKKLGNMEMKLAGNVTGMAARQAGRGMMNLATSFNRGVRNYFGAGSASTGAFVGGAKGRAGGGAGVSDGVGVFSDKSRPEIGGGSFAGSVPSGGVKSEAQKNLAGFKTSSPGGAFNYNPSGTGRANDDRNKGSGASIYNTVSGGSGQGMNMQDIVGGGSGQEIEMQDLSGNSLFTSDDPLNTGFYDPNTGGDKDE